MFEAIFMKNEADKTLTIERQFGASKDKVWTAWTDSKILEQWWAPLPWKAVTVSFDFSEGGKWFYYMQGPDNTKHWSVIEYKTIAPQDSFTAVDAFADEKGNKNEGMPVSDYVTEFKTTELGTRVKVVTTYKNIEDLNRVLEMGMAEGLAMGFRQLDEILAK